MRASLRVVAVGLLVGATSIASIAMPAPAGAGPVAGTGTVHCQFGGTVTFTPSLSTHGTKAESVRVAGSLTKCAGTGSGATVAGATVDGSMTLPTNNCSFLAGSTTSPLTAKIVWKPAAHAATIANSAIRLTSTHAAVTHSGTEAIDSSGSAITGSFAHDTATVHAMIAQKPATISSYCNRAALHTLKITATTSSLSLR